MTTSECSYFGRCLNGPKLCYRCFNHALLKLPEQKVIKKRLRQARRAQNKRRDKFGRQLEEELLARLSVPPEAERSPGSGNFWTRPGDVIFHRFLFDAKERKPIVSRGEKQITIKKSWLDKVLKEAASDGRLPVVAYRHRDDDQIYCILPFEVLHYMIHRIIEKEQEE